MVKMNIEFLAENVAMLGMILGIVLILWIENTWKKLLTFSKNQLRY